MTPAEVYVEAIAAIRAAEFWDWPIPPPISMRNRPRRVSPVKVLESKPSLATLASTTSSSAPSHFTLDSASVASGSESSHGLTEVEFLPEAQIDFSAAPPQDFTKALGFVAPSSLLDFPWDLNLEINTTAAPVTETTYYTHGRQHSASTAGSLSDELPRRTNSSGPSSEQGPLTPDDVPEEPFFDRPPPLPPKQRAQTMPPAKRVSVRPAKFGVPF